MTFHPLRWLRVWFDTQAGNPPGGVDPEDRRLGAAQVASIVFLHAGCLGILWVGWSPTAVAAALGLYLARAFFVTGFYHRLFSHRAYTTSRPAQFVFAVLGGTAVQRGPLWWAAHHRKHHAETDREGDPHSPHQDSFLWSHLGWIAARCNYATRVDLVPDLARFPELRWLDRFDTVVPLAYAAFLYAAGEIAWHLAPWLGTNGPQLLVWGFFVSTVILLHVTSLVNSGAHIYGSRRFATRDESRNNLLIALLAMGEGWHNNHHFYPNAARQGFFWWEIDATYVILKALAWTGLIKDLRPVPPRILKQRAGAR